MDRVLIVGSKGFIGSHIYKYYSANSEYDCWACDVVVDYTDSKYFIIDSSNSDYNEIFESNQFAYCINCSGAASVPDSLIHPLRDFALNTFNVAKLLESIRRYSPQCIFVNLSSAAVYGNPIKLPIIEESDCNPVSPYGNHKFMAEGICSQYHKYFGIRTCSLRIFSAYGPGLKKQLLWDIYQKSKIDKDLILFGTGEETRDFIFIDDIVYAINLVIKRGKFIGQSYNLANGIETSINEIASILLEYLDFTGNIVFSGSSRSGDPNNWWADISSLTQIGFAPKYTIREGVFKYVKWLKENA